MNIEEIVELVCYAGFITLLLVVAWVVLFPTPLSQEERDLRWEGLAESTGWYTNVCSRGNDFCWNLYNNNISQGNRSYSIDWCHCGYYVDTCTGRANFDFPLYPGGERVPCSALTAKVVNQS